jgi:hypothetical protein
MSSEPHASVEPGFSRLALKERGHCPCAYGPWVPGVQDEASFSSPFIPFEDDK